MLKKGSTYIMIAILAVLIFGGIYYFTKEETAAPQPEVEQRSEEIPNIQFADNKLVEVKDGKTKWELAVGGIEYDRKAGQVYLINIKGTFFQDDGSKLDLTAAKAVMDAAKKDIVMTGSVKAESTNGGVITAEEMKWLSDEEHILGSGNVKLMKNDILITGDRVDSDAKLENVKVQGNARVVRGGE